MNYRRKFARERERGRGRKKKRVAGISKGVKVNSKSFNCKWREFSIPRLAGNLLEGLILEVNELQASSASW